MYKESMDLEFDPHEHRKVPNPITYSETMIHLLKGCLGAGMLAMPDAFNRVGIVFGLSFLIFIAVFATYCLNLLIYAQYKQCKKYQVGYIGYPKSMRLALETGPPVLRIFARPMRWSVDIMLIIWQIGVCTIYFVFAAENFKQVFDYYGMVYSVRLLIAFLLLPQVLINLVRDLKFLIPFSAISNLLLISGVLLVFWYLLETDLQPDDELYKLKSITEIPIFIGVTLFALEAVGVVLELERNMEKPSQFTGVCGLLSVGMVVISSVFAAVGLFGCLKYGNQAMGSITLNLPQHDKKAQASKMLLGTALYLSIPLQNYVAYQILWRKINKRPKIATKYVDYTLRVMLIIIPFSLAVAAPSLSGFIGFLGALCLSLVAIMFPAVVDLCVRYPDQYGVAKYRLYRDIAIIFFGLFCCVSGCYTSMLQIIKDTETATAVATTASSVLLPEQQGVPEAPAVPDVPEVPS